MPARIWRGTEVTKRVEEATREAIDETTARAAEHARDTSMDLGFHRAAGYFWFGVTRRLEQAVESEPAKAERGTIVGRFGSTERRGGYGHMLERMHPFLRPAADREFPQLAQRIRDNL